MSRERTCAPADGHELEYQQGQVSTHCLSGDDVLFLFLVESRDAFDSHIVGLSSTRRKDDVLGVSTNQVGQMLRTKQSDDGGAIMLKGATLRASSTAASASQP